MKRIIAIEHVLGEDLGTFQKTLDRLRIPALRVWPVDGDGSEWPELSASDGLIVLGGYMSVHEVDRYPWIQAEVEFIRRAQARGAAILGVCLGMQLLAKSLGAKVFPMPRAEIGMISVQKTAHGLRHPLLADLPNPFWAFSWHGEQIELPLGCQALAGSADCPIQAIACGVRSIGLQFHLEADRSWLKRVLGHPQYARDLPPGAAAGLKRDLEAYEAQLEQAADRLLSRWVELA
ncbi:MAG: type 1 glutamine amidotransferase [Firmicutes bacterium]|nr:type 1 glutamine amidotransferase [Bacillota bacterium]